MVIKDFGLIMCSCKVCLISHLWKVVLKSLVSLLTGTRVTLGDGKDPAFWRDAWCIEVSLANLFPGTACFKF